MRISKSNKTSVKASKKVCASQDRRVVYDKDGIKVATTGRDYDFIATIENDTDEEYCVEDLGLCVPAHDWVGFLADDEGYADLEYFKSLGGVKACGDVKASTQSNIIYNKDGIVVKKTGRDYDFIATIQNNTDDIFYLNIYDPSCDDVDECNVVVNPHDWIGILSDDEGYDIVEYFEKLGGVTASKKLSTTDKALQHIKAAIDILGKSGDKSDVTKDSIANLATVMFDIQSGADIKKK